MTTPTIDDVNAAAKQLDDTYTELGRIVVAVHDYARDHGGTTGLGPNGVAAVDQVAAARRHYWDTFEAWFHDTLTDDQRAPLLGSHTGGCRRAKATT